MIEHTDEVNHASNLLYLYKPSIIHHIAHTCFLKSLLPAEGRSTIDIKQVVIEELKEIFFGLFSFLPPFSDEEWLYILSNLFK